MDPNANLKEQLSLVVAILDEEAQEPDRHAAYRLAELVKDLHEWLTKGGSLPRLWANVANRG